MMDVTGNRKILLADRAEHLLRPTELCIHIIGFRLLLVAALWHFCVYGPLFPFS